MDTRLLYVFARAPEPGRSKTRLIPRLGAEGAARLHAAFVSDVCAVAARVPARRVLAVDGPLDHPLFVELAARHGMAIEAQVDGDLGARMAAAIHAGLRRAHRVCLIGSDLPTLAPSQIARAFDRLDHADVVFGPTDDGGYWLVGARAPCDPLFRDIAWSGPTVLADSLDRARTAGLGVALADRHWDVDEPADLDRLVAWLDAAEGSEHEFERADPASAPARAPATSRTLALAGPVLRSPD